MSSSKPAAKYAESIPAVTAPVKLPRLVPSRVSVLAIAGGMLGVITLALLGYGIGVTL